MHQPEAVLLFLTSSSTVLPRRLRRWPRLQRHRAGIRRRRRLLPGCDLGDVTCALKARAFRVVDVCDLGDVACALNASAFRVVWTFRTSAVVSGALGGVSCDLADGECSLGDGTWVNNADAFLVGCDACILDDAASALTLISTIARIFSKLRKRPFLTGTASTLRKIVTSTPTYATLLPREGQPRPITQMTRRWWRWRSILTPTDASRATS